MELYTDHAGGFRVDVGTGPVNSGVANVALGSFFFANRCKRISGSHGVMMQQKSEGAGDNFLFFFEQKK